MVIFLIEQDAFLIGAKIDADIARLKTGVEHIRKGSFFLKKSMPGSRKDFVRSFKGTCQLEK